MRFLIPLGIVLILAGGAGALTAYMQSAEPDPNDRGVQQVGSEVPATAPNSSGAGALILAPLSGLALALGVGCIGIGMGRWNNPVPADKRTANPWNEQPEKGGPPTGLV